MFILASRSPQRKRILEDLGVKFKVIPSPFDESAVPEQDPIARAKILAEEKAKSVAADHPDQWVIGVDTLVVSEGGELLEKPVDEGDARRMMKLHSGSTSTVHSAICLCRCHDEHGLGLLGSQPQKHTALSTAHVTFKTLTDNDIDHWISAGLWKDRSGAFQIEGEGQSFIEKLEGEFETVIGFPISCFQNMLRKHCS